MDFIDTKNFLLGAGFDNKQWRELKAICEIRQGNYSAKASASQQAEIDVGDEYCRLFYDRLTDILLNHEKIGVAPLGVLKKMQPKQFAMVGKVAAFLYQLSCEWNPTKVRGRNFAIGVFHLYVKLTVEYLRECRVPVSAKAVLQHPDKFVGLVDKAFPSYVKHGLIHVVVLGDKRSTLSA